MSKKIAKIAKIVGIVLCAGVVLLSLAWNGMSFWDAKVLEHDQQVVDMMLGQVAATVIQNGELMIPVQMQNPDGTVSEKRVVLIDRDAQPVE